MAKVQQVNLNIDELKGFLTHIVNNNRFLQQTGKPPAAVEIQGESGIGKTSSAMQLANELKLNYVKLNLAQIEELGDLVGFPVRQFQLCKVGAITTKIEAKQPEMVPVKKMVKKMQKQMVTVMEEREVDDFEIKIAKKQVLVDGKFVTKDIETKVPIKVRKDVPVEKEMEIEVEVEETVMEAQTPATNSAPISADGCQWVDEQAVEEYLKLGYSFTGEKRMSYCPPEWIANKTGGGFLILDDWNRADIRFIQAVMELK